MNPQKVGIDELKKILSYISKGYKVPKVIYDTVFRVAKIEIEEKNRVIMLKRDPNIHRRNIQAAYVTVIEGETIDINPNTVDGYNADFDGDTMALYVPVTKEAQDEAKDRLITTSGSSNLGSVNFVLKNEVFTGLFTLTSEDKNNTPKIIRSLEEADELHPGDKVKVRFKGQDRITTAGRIIFNASLPMWFEFVDTEIDKGKVGIILSQISKRDKGDYVQTIDKLMKLGFKIATKYPRTISMDMLNIPPNLMKLKEDLAKEKDLMKQLDIIKEMEIQLLIHLKKNEPHLYQIIGSGASKGHTQLRQLMIAKGLATDPEGNILPVIARAMNEGYTSEDYFNASGAGRKGVVSRVHFTAHGGYAYRKMIFVMSTLEANPMLRDCETKLTAKIKLTPELFKRMKGRYVQNEPMGKIIPVSEDMIGEIINLRSPIYCKSMKLCRTCYGDLLDQVRTKSVGILAAMECTSLSEKIMKCSDGLVHFDNKLIPFDELYDSVIADDSDGYKEFQENVYCKNGLVSSIQIEKHDPTDKMYFVSTKSGHTLICQGNHPVWSKLNSLHKKYPNKTCRLIGKNQYVTYGSGRDQYFETNDDEMMVVNAEDLERGDCIWIDNTFVEERPLEINPDIDGYLVGFYTGDGSTVGKRKETWTNGFIISQCDNIGIKEYIVEKCKKHAETLVYKQYMVCKDNAKIYNYIKGNRSWKKRLKSDFINYNNDWLREFLSGLIDSNGTVFGGPNNGSTCCRIYTCSYYLVQQLKAISVKLGYSMITNLVTMGGNHKRPHFTCDIRFPEGCVLPNSVKIKNQEGISYLQTKQNDSNIKRGFDIITCVKEISNWNYPVYDIKTENEEYMLGFVLNHNSFHTGGALEMSRPNILQMAVENIAQSDENIVKSLLYQDSMTVLSRDFVSFEIDKNLFTTDKIREEGDSLILPMGFFKMRLGELTVPITIEQELSFHLKNCEREESGEIINLMFGKDIPIFTLKAINLEPADIARRLDSYVGGTSPWTNPESLFLKFYKLLEKTDKWDSVHLECIISNILRWQGNPHFPARVKYPYKPEMFSIKTLPGVMSYPLGLAYENFSKSIFTGMISERATESSIEKVLFGMPLSDIKPIRK